MKYQNILNNKILYSTNSIKDFLHYIMTNKEAIQAKNTLLHNILGKPSYFYFSNLIIKNGVIWTINSQKN